jgi:hypothetical protein
MLHASASSRCRAAARIVCRRKMAPQRRTSMLTFLLSKAPTTTPEMIAASAAWSMAFMWLSLRRLAAPACPSAPLWRVSDHLDL